MTKRIKKSGQKSVVEKLDRFGTEYSYQVVWHAIRQLKSEFTVADISCHLLEENVSELTIDSYLTRLHRGGFIECIKQPYKGSCIANYWTLVKDVGHIAPKLTKSGKPSTRGNRQDAMWRSMKMLGQFTARDIALTASTNEQEIKLTSSKTYIRHLHKAGYLRMTRKSERSNPALYQLISTRNTGPKPPMVLRTKDVYDQNTNQIITKETRFN